MDEENVIKTDRISDDALIIYCNEDNEICFHGNPKFLANKDHYIKVSILKGIFTISSCEKVDLTSNRCMYFPMKRLSTSSVSRHRDMPRLTD